MFYSRAGWGLDSLTKQCELCLNGYYSLNSGIESCQFCNNLNKEDNGVDCVGEDNIELLPDFWVGIRDEMFTDPMSTEATLIFGDDKSIITADCPTSYCCTVATGCNYKQDIDAGLLCAFGRGMTIYTLSNNQC